MADRIDYRFVLRRGLAAEWAAQNGVLLEGEFGLELDTGRVKLGDGATAWNALPYSDWFTPDVLVEGTHVGISFAYDAATRRLNATVTGGGGGGGAGEILVVDGVSPPVMLTNESETDFLYAG